MREDDKRIAEWLGVFDKFQCCVDGEEDADDTCVLDKGLNYRDCTYGQELHNNNKPKTECTYWVNTNKVALDYTTSDADAISLLPVLVERGYGVSLIGQEGVYVFDIVRPLISPIQLWSGEGASIAAAITTATLQLIESEATA